MYLFQSQCSSIFPERRLRENIGEAHGKFILASVVLHLIIAGFFISWHHGKTGRLISNDRIVEVRLVNIRQRKHADPDQAEDRKSREIAQAETSYKPAVNVINSIRPQHVPEKHKPLEAHKKKTETKADIRKDIVPDTEKIKRKPETGPVNNAINENSLSRKNILYGTTEKKSGIIPDNTAYTDDGHSDISGVSHTDKASSGRRYVDENFYYIKDLITGSIVYPRLARKMKWQGTLTVSFTVLENGAVENIKVIRSSGHSILDKNVIKTIKQVQPFPPPPAAADFTMPIKYTLRN